MFNELTNFAFARSTKEAFGFYLAYFLLIVVSAGVLSGIAGILFFPDIDPEQGFELGQRIGAVVALISCMFLSMHVLRSKKLSNNFSSYIFFAATAALAFLGGALLGMIPVAYLTTKKSAGESLPPLPAPAPTTPPNTPQDGAGTEVQP